MWKPKSSSLLPWRIFSLSVLGYLLRSWLYAAAQDRRGLLTPNHPLEIALWLLTAGTLLYIICTVWKLDGAKAYGDNFFPSLPAALGHVLAAAGILATTLPYAPQLPGTLGEIWKVLGILSCPCLLLAGYCRLVGKKPYFLLHLIPCLFLLFHIINHYRRWSGQPQLQDCIFLILGSISLMFFAYYTTAYDVDITRRRMQLGMGLAAAYFSIVSLPMGADRWLYIGGAVWALTGICTTEPKPLPPEEPKQEDPAGKEKGTQS